MNDDRVPWWAWGSLVMVAIVVLAWWMIEGRQPETQAVAAAQPDYPICAETAGGVELTLEKREVGLQLSPRCWSGWVTLPVEVDFDVRNKGDIEYLFWDGARRAAIRDETRWLGTIPGNTFRLRGEGVATIVISPPGAPTAAQSPMPKTEPPAQESQKPAPTVPPTPPADPQNPPQRVTTVVSPARQTESGLFLLFSQR